MTARTRQWLRTFLQIGARADKEGISATDVSRQEDTIIRALNMLDEKPGIVLADEVGMGKTYEALGIAATARYVNPHSRIVVITPGPDLNDQWLSAFSRFTEMFDFGTDVYDARTLSEFIQLVRTQSIVVAPVTMFQSGRSAGDQAYLLSLYFYWKGLHGNTANAIMARFRDGEYDRIDVTREKFLDVFCLDQVRPHLKAAFRRGQKRDSRGLDDLYKSGGLSAFENPEAVHRSLYHARFVLTGKLMPMVDFLIVDEAHKLKNPSSLRTRAMKNVFRKRFRKSLFLTATPFQLNVAELREIFSLFAGAKDAPSDLIERVEELLIKVSHYQQKYEEFQQTWSSLDPSAAAKFRTLYDSGPTALDAPNDPALEVIANQVAALKHLKTETIQPGFRAWMIRSLREDKRQYRKHIPKTIPPVGAGALPFLIYERFIAELFRRGRRTHKAAVEINMVSSYAAALQGAILSSTDGIPTEAEGYRELLCNVLGEIESDKPDHPKIAAVIANTLDAAERGEKTLVFCSRTATLEHLRRQLDAFWKARLLKRWQKVYPGAGNDDIFDTSEGDDKRHRGRHSLLQARFHRSQDALYLALREPYLRTLAPLASWALQRPTEVMEEANRILQYARVGKTAAERLDYQLAKRCVEQAVVRLRGLGDTSETPIPDYINSMLRPDYIRLGFHLTADDLENDSIGDEQPQWQISERVVRMVIGAGESLWESQADLLGSLSLGLRIRVAEQLVRYLTYTQVPFLADLLIESKASGLDVDQVQSAALLEYMPAFWQTDTGRRWVELLRMFLEYFIRRDPHQQEEILKGPIKTIEFSRHTREGESRKRLREAFNTPLYPMILIANEVMQEGLDLHKQCRRVVHHDLVWNPAHIEQRIGRIDRLGSLTSQLRKNRTDVTLDVLYPIILGTIDERLYRTVKTREKWLEFLLGAVPNFSEYSLDDEEPSPLPDRLGADLAIDLGPSKE